MQWGGRELRQALGDAFSVEAVEKELEQQVSLWGQQPQRSGSSSEKWRCGGNESGDRGALRGGLGSFYTESRHVEHDIVAQGRLARGVGAIYEN